MIELIKVMSYLFISLIVLTSISLFIYVKRKEKNDKKVLFSYFDLLDEFSTPIITLQKGNIIFANKAAEQLLGKSKKELMNTEFINLLPSIQMYVELERIKKEYEGIQNYNQFLLDKEGNEIEVSIDVVPSIYNNSIVQQLYIKKILDKKEESIREKIYYSDYLTKLPNRVFLTEKVANKIACLNKNYYMLYINLISFQNIANLLGTTESDKLLLQFSYLLKDIIGEKNLLCRVNIDQFLAIIMDKENTEEIIHLIEQIGDALKTPWIINSIPYYLKVAIGIADSPSSNLPLEIVLKNSEIAMKYAEKDGAVNYKFFTEEMKNNMLKKAIMESEIRKGIEKEEFIVFYQPQIDVKTKKMVGMEALLRWKKSDDTILTPYHFIEIAEETNLIVEIGKQIFKKICMQIKEWQDYKFERVKVGINISLKQFQDPDFIDFVLSTISVLRVDPSWIEIEITESLFLTELEEVIEKLEILRNLGITIAIDDFGTGYSSLSYLKKLPVDKLKIDKSFIDDISVSQTGFSIVKTIVELAKSMNKTVTAEGVETQEQYHLLKETNCDQVQGYYFSKPVPTKEIIEYWKVTV